MSHKQKKSTMKQPNENFRRDGKVEGLPQYCGRQDNVCSDGTSSSGTGSVDLYGELQEQVRKRVPQQNEITIPRQSVCKREYLPESSSSDKFERPVLGLAPRNKKGWTPKAKTEHGQARTGRQEKRTPQGKEATTRKTTKTDTRKRTEERETRGQDSKARTPAIYSNFS